ncbi:hypothetical protein HYH03_003826 [Edaphochlamys debaryana]|uniref:Uncharacterized protein n=1 Tax=Edaphochlamys debaryana TaxID=47281 RepID=A0A835YC15_9CHLO|nr:hypothetical protein HYH03_003826 [Edaphochlamys debaryana]|eukprot:KAG2498066.1 hypothetical protein HYH03_003826 [Edaphochlamys debaryana]
MPPRRRGVAQPGAASSSGAGPSDPTFILPAPLRSAWEALPDVAEVLLPPAAGQASTSGRRRQTRLTRAKAVQHIQTLLTIPHGPTTVPVSGLLANSAAAGALLRLHAAAVRGPDSAGPLEDWQSDVLDAVVGLLFGCYPLNASRHGVSVLCFVLALLRTHTLQALSRRLAAAATERESQGSSAAAGSGSGNGSGAGGTDRHGDREARGSSPQSPRRKWIDRCNAHLVALFGVLEAAKPSDVPRSGSAGTSSPEAAAEVASLRAVCVEEYARGLAESGILEHAARALLLLQARGPGATLTTPLHLDSLVRLWGLALRAESPTIVAHLRTAYSGPCVRTAVLVYGVGTLRLLDGGPSYGLPAALQTAGLSLRKGVDGRAIDPVALLLLFQMVSAGAPPSGPAAGASLALRIGRVAVAAEHVRPRERGPESPDLSSLRPLPALPASAGQLSRALRKTADVALWALNCGHVELQRLQRLRGASPHLPRLLAEWWQLAAWIWIHDAWGEDPPLLCSFLIKPVLAVWPNGRLDLDALPPEPPADVAAALAAGLLPALQDTLQRCLPAAPTPSVALWRGLFSACNEACPDGLALFLAPLLAYGEPGQVARLLAVLGLAGGLVQLGGLLTGVGGASAAGPQGGHRELFRQEATSLLGALAGALQHCRRLGPAAAEEAAGPAEAAARAGSGAWEASEAEAGARAAGDPPGAGLPSPPLEQLRPLVFLASEQWGLPLPALDGAAGNLRGAAQPGAASSSGAGPSDPTFILPAPLRSAWEALPDVAEVLLPPAAGQASTSGRRRQTRLTRAKAVQHLGTLLELLTAAAENVAASLLTNTASADGVLRLHAGALRGPDSAGPLEDWHSAALSAPVLLLHTCSPLPANRHALSVLRFVLAMLRAQTLPALSRRLAAVATEHEPQGSSAAGRSGSGNGSGARGTDRHWAGGAAGSSLQITRLEWINTCNLLVGTLSSVLYLERNSPRISPPEESMHKACADEFARGLAESRLLEHAARALLLLQARGPAETRSIALGLFLAMDRLWCEVVMGGNSTRAAHFQTALCGPCVRTAVLVYGVGTLRLLDGGPSCGLPAALQTAGLALLKEEEDRATDGVALQLFLRVLVYSAARGLGHAAGASLALRTGRAAAAALSRSLKRGPGSPDLSLLRPLPASPASTVKLSDCRDSITYMAVMAASCGHLELQRLQRRRSASLHLPRLLGEWWQLAAWIWIHDAWGEEPTSLCSAQANRLAGVWPDGRLDLDALSPEPPAEVAAALAAGLLPALQDTLQRCLPAAPTPSVALWRGLFSACNEACPGGSGFARFLAPLLAYGEPGQAEGLLGALGRAGGLVGPSGGGASTQPFREAATSLLGALAGALQRCRRLGPAAVGAPAGPVEAAAGGAFGYWKTIVGGRQVPVGVL